MEKSKKDSSSVVACIQSDQSMIIITDNPIIKILEINDISCSVHALIDIESPISFISISAFKKFFYNIAVALKKPDQSYNAVYNNITIPILGSFETQIKLDALLGFNASIKLHVLYNNVFSTDFIIGRDFASRHEISVIFNYNENKAEDRVKLFADVASTEVIEKSVNKTNDFLSEIERL